MSIRGVDGKYLKVRSTDGLEFENQKLDDTAKFSVIAGANGEIQFKSVALDHLTSIILTLYIIIPGNQKLVGMHYLSDVKCDGSGANLSAGIIYLPLGQMSFKITGYQSQECCTRYLSSQAGNEAYNGSVAVKEFEDFTYRFTV